VSHQNQFFSLQTLGRILAVDVPRDAELVNQRAETNLLQSAGVGYCCQPPPNAWYNWTRANNSLSWAWTRASSAEKALVSLVKTSR
jgi:hypothetical protein